MIASPFTRLLLLLFFFLSSYLAATSRPLAFHPGRRLQQIHSEIRLSTMRDLMSQLHNNGFGYLARAIEDKEPELVALNNMTIFAVEDSVIANGSQGYMSRVDYHIVTNRFLMKLDLDKLPEGTTLATLMKGQWLRVTSTGTGSGEGGTAQLMINNESIKDPDVIVLDFQIVVQCLYKPFQIEH